MKKPKSLSANIANLLNSLPQGFDDEDEIDDTNAKVLTADSDESDGEEIIERSKIRTKNIDLLENIDKKYAGKISNRKNFEDSDSDKEDEDNEEASDKDNDYASDEDNKVASDESINSENSDEDISYDKENNDSNVEGSNESDVEDESEIEEGSDISEGSGVDNEDDENFKHFTDSTSKDETNKGQCVRNQLSIWESLLEIRIKSKKALSASNKMPVGEKFNEILNNADEECQKKLSETKKNISNLLDKLFSLQTLLLNKYPETKKLLSKTKENKQDKDDEEITSEEESDDEPEIKRVKIQDIGKSLSDRHEIYKVYRNKTIEKWYDKTRIKHTGSNSHTLVDHINNTLMDKSKLLQKSQMKKSTYNIIGEKEAEEEYNVNIYDDDDFYHQQLRELVEFKSSDITDPLQLSRQWVQLQNMRSKMKRKIDTRATKGRKLRFGVHSKLVNHIACREYENSKTEEAKKELLNSIFQKSN